MKRRLRRDPGSLSKLLTMNEYLRSKCSSEQQLLNELAKLLGAKDVASRKMADVVRALTLFYTSAARGARIPQSLLSGLCALLPQLKDKKEIALLKDEHQRIARIALCLLARLVDQFEIQRELAARLTDSQRLEQTQGADPAEQVLTTFLLSLETAVMTPSGLLQPRQRVSLRVYAQLCRVFRKREQLVSFTTVLLQQSPALVENPVDAKGKRLPPPGPAQLGAVAGACHALRFHTAPDEQVFGVDKLVQLAFTTPAGTASRHAAKIILSLLTSSVLNEERPSNAVATAKAIELYLLKARPRTLLGGDSLTSVYVLRLCGQMYRVPVHQQQQQASFPSSSAGSMLDSPMVEAPSNKAQQQPTSDQNPALQGFFVSNALSAQLQDYLMEVVQAAATDGAPSSSVVTPAVLLVAIEEVLRGATPEASLRKQPNWGSKCIFELVAVALLSLLPISRDTAKTASNTVILHRVCRAVQFVAERLDAVVLQANAMSGQTMLIPAYLSGLMAAIRSLTEHSNAFVACEALRAFVWLLPRDINSLGQNGNNQDDWSSLFWQLETLPFNRIQPERRAAIAWTLFRRCVTTSKSNGHAIETPLLSGCLRVVLAWFRARPCVWHAALLTSIWHTALRECLAPLGDAVFASIVDVLDFQCAPTDSAAANCLVAKQRALQFLSHREGGARYAVQHEAWRNPLILRLAKQALLETSTSQRLSLRALTQMRDEAQLQDLGPLVQQLTATLSFFQKRTRQSRPPDPAIDVELEEQASDDPFADVVRAKSATASDFTNWNASNASIDTEDAVIEDASFKAPPSSPFDAGAGGNGEPTQLSNMSMGTTEAAMPAFSSWGDDGIKKEEALDNKAAEAFFEDFSAPGGTAGSGFGAWGQDQPSDAPQEDFGASFGDFGTASSAAEFTSWPTEQSQDPSSAFIVDNTAFRSNGTDQSPESTFPSWGTFDVESGSQSDLANDVAHQQFQDEKSDEQNASSKASPATEWSTLDVQHSNTPASTTDEFAFAPDFGMPTPDFDSSAAATSVFDSGAVEEQQTTLGDDSVFTVAADTEEVVASARTGSFTPDFGAAAGDFSPAGADSSVTSEFDGSTAETSAFNSGAVEEQQTTFGDDSVFTVAADTEEVVASARTGSFTPDFGAPAGDFSPAGADSSVTSEFDGSTAETSAVNSGAVEEQQTTFGDDSVFTVAADTEEVVASARTGSFTPNFGAAAGDFSPAGADSSVTSEFDGSTAETSAFNSGAVEEQQTTFGDDSVFTVAADTEEVVASARTGTFTPNFGAAAGDFSPAGADSSVTSEFDGSTAETSAFNSGAVEEQQTTFGDDSVFTVAADTEEVVASARTGSFTPNFGAAAGDFSPAGADSSVTSEFDGSTAETSAFNSGAVEEQQTTFGDDSVFTVAADTEEVVASARTGSFTPNFGAAAGDFSPAGADSSVTSEFDGSTAETSAFNSGAVEEQQTTFGDDSVFTVAADTEEVVASARTGSFTPDFGAPAGDFSPAGADSSVTSEFDGSTAETSAVNSGAVEEQQTTFGDDSVFTVAADTEEVVASARTGSFTPDFGAPAGDFSPAGADSSVTSEFDGSTAETSAFNSGAVEEQQTTFGDDSVFTVAADTEEVVASARTGSFTPDFGAPAGDFSPAGADSSVTSEFDGSTAETSAVNSGAVEEQQTTFGDDSVFTVAADTEEVVASARTGSFTPDFGAPAGDFSPAGADSSVTSEFDGSTAETSAFNSGAVEEQQTTFGDDSVFTVAADTEEVVASARTGSFTPDFGAPAGDFSPAGADSSVTSEFDGSTAETSAFNSGAVEEQQTTFGDDSVFTVAADTEEVVASARTGSFTPDFGAPAGDFSPAGADSSVTSEFDGSTAETSAFNSGAVEEQQTTFGDDSVFTVAADTEEVVASARTGSFTPDFGAPAGDFSPAGADSSVTSEFDGSTAETSAVNSGAVEEQQTTFGDDSVFTVAADTEEVVASARTGSFTPDFGAPAGDFSPAGADSSVTSEFDGSTAETSAFNSGAVEEQQTTFGDDSVFTVAADTEEVVASARTGSFTPDFGAPAGDFSPAGADSSVTSEFDGSTAETSAFNSGAVEEQQTTFGDDSVFTVAADTEEVVASARTGSFTPDFGAPAGDFSPAGADSSVTSEFDGSTAETSAFNSGAVEEQQTTFGDDSVFTVAADTEEVVASARTGSFTPDFGAPAGDFSPAGADSSVTSEFDGSTAETSAFNSGAVEEQQTTFGDDSVFTVAADTEEVVASARTGTFTPNFGAAAGDFSPAGADSSVTSEFDGSTAETSAFNSGAVEEQQTTFGDDSVFTVAADTEEVVASARTGSFTPDFGAPAGDFSPAGADSSVTSEFDGSTAETSAVNSGAVEEQQTTFGDDSVFTVAADTEEVVASARTGSFTPDFGAPAGDFSPAGADSSVTSEFDGSTAETSAFNSGAVEEQQTTFGDDSVFTVAADTEEVVASARTGSFTPDFGAAAGDFSPAGADSSVTSEFDGSTAETSAVNSGAVEEQQTTFGDDSVFTVAADTEEVVASARTGSFTPDFGAPAGDFSPAGADSSVTSEFDGSTAETSAFNSGAVEEQQTTFGDDSVFTVAADTEEVVASARTGSFTPDFGAPAGDFSPAGADSSVTSEFDGSTAETSAFNSGAVEEQQTTFGDDSVFTVAADTEEVVASARTGSFTPDFGAPAGDFSPAGADSSVTSEFDGSTAETSAFNSGAVEEQQTTFGDDSVFTVAADTEDVVASARTGSFTPDFGAPAGDFSPAGADSSVTSEFDGSTAETSAFNSGAVEEQQTTFGDDSVFTVAADTEEVVASARTGSFTPDFGAPAGDFSPAGADSSVTSEFDGSTAETSAFNSGAVEEQQTTFGDDSVFTVAADTEEVVASARTGSFTPDFGAAAGDFSPAGADSSVTSEFDGSTAETSAFNSGAVEEQQTTFGDDSVFTVAADTEEVVASARTGSFTPDFGAPSGDFSPAGADSSVTSEFDGSTAETSAVNSGAVEEQQTTFGDDSVFTVAADTEEVVASARTGSFTPDFGAPAGDFSPAGADSSVTSEFDGSTAETSAFNSGAVEEQQTTFGDDSVFTVAADTEEVVLSARIQCAMTGERQDIETVKRSDGVDTFGTGAEGFREGSVDGGRSIDGTESFFTCATGPQPGSVGDVEALSADSDPDFTINEDVRKPDKPFQVADEFSDAREFDEYAEYVAASIAVELKAGDVSFDDEFDEIFGDAQTTSDGVSGVNASADTPIPGLVPNAHPGADKFDEEFDDIFGDPNGQTASGEASSGSPDESSYSCDKVTAESEAIDKKDVVLGGEHQTDSGVEVRTGTPASEFTFR